MELCVAKADGTGSIAVARGMQEGLPQVVWAGNTRLICVTEDKIFAVDADGRNKLDLIETLRKRFPDQFEQEKEEEGGEQEETTGEQEAK